MTGGVWMRVLFDLHTAVEALIPCCDVFLCNTTHIVTKISSQYHG